LIPRFQRGAISRDILPDHTAEEREFLISGTTPREWEELFGVDVGPREFLKVISLPEPDVSIRHLLTSKHLYTIESCQ
jgi:hypothetical protein